ncbi:hypothetical protein PTSG_06948 [Salpingoeca rosetta]|uniref:Matrin-type domain-containing protein n=1 Tax=Salpingoeca rosetta (strain ATCC 50818 / BSB-021) TaxID=946362 RepID=F2UF96_SALR5|nr:uncharacterized protein PTSG_06948 [Salpingoeca rosetta]EGD75296.1 hypothetical protein PTSG_06948 [Salpingoeca rosetta]|eukprot:XP_004992349.1 hypothetical protein PTSG_06948 [Salpingoeca rosetta]
MADQHDAVGFVDATNRRTFDVEAYAKRAKERLEREEEEAKGIKRKPKPVQRPNLKARDFKVDLESRVGKTRIIDSQRSVNSGYYCDVCDCVLKDSVSFLDHINGKKHQRNLGMSMRVDRSSVSDVQQKLQELKRRKERAKRGATVEYSLDAEEARMVEEDDKRKKAKREEAKRKKKEQRDRELEERRKRVQERLKEHTSTTTTTSSSSSSSRSRVKDTHDEEDVEQEGIDPALAAAMGFSSFS